MHMFPVCVYCTVYTVHVQEESPMCFIIKYNNVAKRVVVKLSLLNNAVRRLVVEVLKPHGRLM